MHVSVQVKAASLSVQPISNRVMVQMALVFPDFDNFVRVAGLEVPAAADPVMIALYQVDVLAEDAVQLRLGRVMGEVADHGEGILRHDSEIVIVDYIIIPIIGRVVPMAVDMALLHVAG